MKIHMRYAFWFYVCKISAPLVFIGVAVGFCFRDRSPWLEWVGIVSVAVLIALGVSGAVMGLLLALGRLRMICPFCGDLGEPGGDKEHGLWLYCDNCGFIHGTGFLKMRLAAQKLEADDEVETEDGDSPERC